MTNDQINVVLQVIPWIFVAITQGAALIGKPAVVEAVKPLSAIFDIIAGNYRKAKNIPQP
jgi:hypothetical protein